MNNPPKWFTIVAVIALLWNLLGCVAFFADLHLSPQDVAQLSAAEKTLYDARPNWALAATALAVLGGAVGCIGLLLRRKWARIPFWLSLFGLLVQDFGLFVLVDGVALAGSVAVVMQSIVLLVAIGLVVLGTRAIRRGWLG